MIETPRRCAQVSGLALVAVTVQAGLLMEYAGAEWLPAMIDGCLGVALLGLLIYLSWFVIGFVSLMQTNVMVAMLAMLFWLAGGFAVQQMVEQGLNVAYVPFVVTLPFRLVVGVLCWAMALLWYRLQILHVLAAEVEEAAEERELQLEQPMVEESVSAESMDRITVKDGSRIHLIPTDELLYIQACGDYVTLVTLEGQYVKEQTMKYFEAHLPATGFVRVHRSTIVNVTQISRVELFSKENYQLLLKNGVKLRVSQSGYRLLKERLEL